MKAIQIWSLALALFFLYILWFVQFFHVNATSATPVERAASAHLNLNLRTS